MAALIFVVRAACRRMVFPARGVLGTSSAKRCPGSGVPYVPRHFDGLGGAFAGRPSLSVPTGPSSAVHALVLARQRVSPVYSALPGRRDLDAGSRVG